MAQLTDLVFTKIFFVFEMSLAITVMLNLLNPTGHVMHQQFNI
jgi:hypothetical protein